MNNDLISRSALLDKIGWWIEDMANAHLLDERYYRAMKRAEAFVEEMPAVDAVEVVRCRDCVYWKPRHIRLKDGTERSYMPGEDFVEIDIGINVGSKCVVDEKSYYGCDKTVFRKECDFCSRGYRKSDAEVEGC